MYIIAVDRQNIHQWNFDY